MLEIKSEEKTCSGCIAPCCRYIAIEVNEPEDQSDIDLYKWYILHQNISLQIDPDGSWHVIVPTKCEALSEENLCTLHETRPNVCREYTLDECERYGPEEEKAVTFNTVDELEKYAREKGLYV